jgi:hypothetical protein
LIEITKEQAAAELRRRALLELRERDPQLYKAEIRRCIVKSMTRKQRAVLETLRLGARFIAMCCGRRGGKTDFLAKLIVLTLLEAGHNEAVFYVAWSLKIGKGLIWKELDKLCSDYCLDSYWRVTEHEGKIDTPEGGGFFILGLNKAKQSNLTRGFKAKLFCVDESQDVEHLLASTLTAVSPALSDTRGAFIAAGTGPYVTQGTWHDWSTGKSGGFVSFNWTVLDNEKFPQDPIATLAEERKRNGYDTYFEEHGKEHPDFIREWLGQGVDDVSTLMCEYMSERNAISELPPTYNLGWRHVIGMDFGWDDGIAWVVVAANPYGPERIVVYAERHEKMDNDAAAEITSRLVKDYYTSYVVCDPAGGGKGFYETFNSRYGKELGCQIRHANKLGKVDSVKTINTELRRLLPDSKFGRLMVYVTEAEPLAKELRVLRWKDKQKGEVLTSKTVRDDCFDAFRYAMVEIAPWQEKEAPSPEKQAAAQVEAEWKAKCKADPEAREREERNRKARSQSKNKSTWW